MIVKLNLAFSSSPEISKSQKLTLKAAWRVRLRKSDWKQQSTAVHDPSRLHTEAPPKDGRS